MSLWQKYSKLNVVNTLGIWIVISTGCTLRVNSTGYKQTFIRLTENFPWLNIDFSSLEFVNELHEGQHDICEERYMTRVTIKENNCLTNGLSGLSFPYSERSCPKLYFGPSTLINTLSSAVSPGQCHDSRRYHEESEDKDTSPSSPTSLLFLSSNSGHVSLTLSVYFLFTVLHIKLWQIKKTPWIPQSWSLITNTIKKQNEWSILTAYSLMDGKFH